MVSEAKYKTIHRDGLKILTLKQMIKRLPIALPQVKAGSTPENLIRHTSNETRQMKN